MNLSIFPSPECLRALAANAEELDSAAIILYELCRMTGTNPYRCRSYDDQAEAIISAVEGMKKGDERTPTVIDGPS